MWSEQAAYDVRVEWGGDGLAALAARSDVVVIVDVLCFSTCVDVAVGRGASVFPCAAGGEAARDLAERLDGICAEARGGGRFSLSPVSFQSADAGQRIVLPSPNGSALSLVTSQTPTLTACLRNAPSVAEAAACIGRRIAIIAAGERWPTGGLRPALEDWIGAGAVVAHLKGSLSPEAQGAKSAFGSASRRLGALLRDCVSGRELLERRFGDDLAVASEWNVSRCAPILRDGAFVDGGSRSETSASS